MAQITANSPFNRVKAGFGSKQSLIDKVKSLTTDGLWIDRLNADKSWASVSNAKLLRVHDLLVAVKERFASRDEIVTAILNAEGRGKDKLYANHFSQWPLPRLMDALRAAERRARRSSAVAAKPGAKSEPGPSKAPKAAATARSDARPAANADAKTAAKPKAAKAEGETKPAARRTKKNEA